MPNLKQPYDSVLKTVA